MFKQPYEQVGILLTNPNRIKQEEQLLINTLIELTTNLISAKKEINTIKYFSSKIPNNQIGQNTQDNLYNIESLDIDKTNIKEYEQFFESHEQKLVNLIDYFINGGKKLNKTATIGPDPYNMFINKIDKTKDTDVFSGKTDDILAKSPVDFFQIDFESKRSLNQQTTDFISQKLLSNKSKYLHFVISATQLLVNKIKSIPEIANNFVDINIVLKGGNLLKLLFEKISKDLNSQINDYLQNKFGKNFSSSDFDFDLQLKANDSINLNTYNNLRVFVSNLLIIYMIVLRNIIFENKEYFFDFYNLNEKAQHKMINELIKNYNKSIENFVEDDINTSKITGNPRQHLELDGAKIVGLIYDYDANKNNYISYSIPGEPPINLSFLKTDFNIINDEIPNEKKAVRTEFNLISHNNYFARLGINLNVPELVEIKKSINNTTNNFYYNTGNINVHFGSRAKFSLFRTKINFIGKIKFADKSYKFIQLPGELLDISVPKINDFKLLTAKPEHYITYLIKNIDKSIKAQSHEGLINEIITIIFRETDYKPWVDIKYNKRVIRLVLLVTLKLLYGHENVSFREKIELCEKIYKSINNNFTSLDLNSEQTMVFSGILSDFYTSIKETHQYALDPNYQPFINTINEVFIKMIKVLKLHYNFSLNKGNIHKITYLDGF